jgi:hypothetical protein
MENNGIPIWDNDNGKYMENNIMVTIWDNDEIIHGMNHI